MITFWDKKKKQHRFIEKIDNDLFISGSHFSEVRKAKKALSKGGYKFVL